MLKRKLARLYHYTKLTLKGMAMGAANKIPGVSGGTLAFVTGIYDEYILSLRRFNLKALQLFLRGKFRQFAIHINLKFLLAVFGGIIISFFSLSLILDGLMLRFPIFVWSGFFGMILGSLVFLISGFKHWGLLNIILMFLGMSTSLLFSFMEYSHNAPDSLWFSALSGVISVCGMVLPGLSGSFLLMLIGNYKFLMVDSINAVFYALQSSLMGNFSFFNNPEQIFLIKTCLVFVIGSVVGVIIISHIFGWLLRKYHSRVVSLIIGFVLGSLAIIYPWKTPIYQLDNTGKIFLDSKAMPIVTSYQHYLPNFSSSEFLVAIIVMVFCAALTMILEKAAKKRYL